MDMKQIKFLVMDVDGTLTDGKLYIGATGEILKAFNIKDGCGISLILPKMGIIPIIITARESDILEVRCAELNIREIHQGSLDKLETLKQVLSSYGDGLDSVAYIGDDLPDIPCMKAVSEAGWMVLCPDDAIPEIKALSDYVSNIKAGEGAVRDCINHLKQTTIDHKISERVRNVIDLILSGNYIDQPSGVLRDGSSYSVQEYSTKAERNCPIETHRKHIDVQYMIEGREELIVYDPGFLTSLGPYDEEKDVEYWQNGLIGSRSILVPGSMIVVYNNQPHKGGIIHRQSEDVRKLVCKICI